VKRALALIAVVTLAGCSEKPLAQAARLAGVNELVQIDKYVYSTSTDRDELRVLDLAPANVTGRQFKLAPNPLEPLSIPVVSRPSFLARDVRYVDGALTVSAADGETATYTQPDGTSRAYANGELVPLPGYVEEGGPYVYAVAAGGTEISVVDGTPDPDDGSLVTERTNLREVKRLLAPAPISAMSALRVSDTESLLAYATWDGRRAQLLTVSLPEPKSAARLTQQELVARTRVIDALPGEVVSALLLLSDHSIAVATRKDRGSTGRSFIFDTRTLATIELQFGGPVRALVTHSGAWSGATVYGPRRRIFGVLDEEACGNPGCGGIVAVDTATGTRGVDVGGQPMFTLSVGDALVQGLAFAPGMLLNLPTGPESYAAINVPLLGVATSSAGTLVFFDALGLAQLDFDGKAPGHSEGRLEFPPTTEKPRGSVETYQPGPVLVDSNPDDLIDDAPKYADGAVRTQTVFFANQGAIPDLNSLPTTSSDGVRFPVPNGWASRARVGDHVVIFGGDGQCADELVTAVLPDALEIAQVPATCPGRSSFGVRAGDLNDPFVVAGTANGFMGRTGPGQTFTFASAYDRHPAGYDASVPGLKWVMGQVKSTDLPKDARWVLEVADHYAPYVATIDSSAGCAPSLPGTPVLDNVRQRLFVAYASANGIVEVDPTVAYRGALSRNVYCYR
jgi:hypothetical protein